MKPPVHIARHGSENHGSGYPRATYALSSKLTQYTSTCGKKKKTAHNQRPRIHPLKNHSRTNRNLTAYETSSFSFDVCFNGYLICSGTKSGEEDVRLSVLEVLMNLRNLSACPFSLLWSECR
ncbi:hypothetical protein YC2023_095549 [Brassica napus]